MFTAKNTLIQLESFLLRFYKLHYARSSLKLFWTLLLPLMISFSIVVIFTNIFNIKNESLPLTIVSGYIFWQCFSGTFSRGVRILLEERFFFKNLSTNKIFFIPAFVLFHLLISMPGILIINLYCWFTLSFSIINLLYLALTMILLYLFISGLVFIFSTWNVFYSDLSHGVDTLLVFLLWLSPIFYNAKDLPDSFNWITYVNPLSWGVTCFRFSTGITSTDTAFYFFSAFSAISIFIFIFGIHYYLKHQRELIKFL